jgi:hypothetical protein
MSSGGTNPIIKKSFQVVTNMINRTFPFLAPLFGREAMMKDALMHPRDSLAQICLSNRLRHFGKDWQTRISVRLFRAVTQRADSLSAKQSPTTPRLDKGPPPKDAG